VSSSPLRCIVRLCVLALMADPPCFFRPFWHALKLARHCSPAWHISSLLCHGPLSYGSYWPKQAGFFSASPTGYWYHRSMVAIRRVLLHTNPWARLKPAHPYDAGATLTGHTLGPALRHQKGRKFTIKGLQFCLLQATSFVCGVSRLAGGFVIERLL